MAWLFDTKPVPEPMMNYYQLDPRGQTSIKFEPKYSKYSLKEIHLKCHLQDISQLLTSLQRTVRTGPDIDIWIDVVEQSDYLASFSLIVYYI